MDEVLSFSIPESKVVQYKSGIPGKTIEDMHRGEHAAIYIGKMSPDNKWIYHADSLEGMMKFASLRKQDKEYIRIVAWPTLYQILAGEKAQEILDVPTQFSLLQDVWRKAWLKKNMLRIENMEEMHPELFHAIRTQGIGALKGHPTLTKESTSLQVAQLLYTLTEKYPSIQRRMFWLVPSDMKWHLSLWDPLYYYGLIEIACRLHDRVHGITLQGGMIRQKEYDEVMDELLRYPVEEIPEIAVLHAWLEKHSAQELSTWYFKNKTYKELLPKQQEKERMKKNIKNIVATTAISIASLFAGWAMTHQYMKQKEQHAMEVKQEKLLLQKLKYEKVWVGIGNRMDYKRYESNEKKLELMRNTTDRVYHYILQRYSTDPAQENTLRAIIQNELVKEDIRWAGIVANNVNRNFDQGWWAVYHFIENNVIKNNALILQSINMDITPYSNLLTHKALFEETLNSPDSFTVENKFVQVNGGETPLERYGATTFEHLWTFASRNYDREYDLARVVIDKNSVLGYTHKEFVVAKDKYSHDKIYTTDEAKKVIKELLPLRDDNEREKR